MRVGFTGTRKGMTDYQKRILRERLKVLQPTEFHHGDCIGADEEAVKIARELDIFIIGHPPIDKSHRAYAGSDIVEDPKQYLARNRDIVDQTDLLFVAPKTKDEELRSGTWATWRYAHSRNGLIEVLWP